MDVCIENWIRTVETLTDEDGESLLSNFPDDCHESHDLLMNRINEFVQVRTVPSQRIINKLQDHIIDDVLLVGVNKIVTTWSVSTVTPEAQRSQHDLTDKLLDKIHFLVAMHIAMLNSKKWKDLHHSIYTVINNVFLEIITLIEKYPHHPSDFVKTVIHLMIKSYISNFCCNILVKMLQRDFGRVPVDLFVPTMRRLGMLDVLDNQWNMFGAWDQICLELRKHARTDLHFDYNTNADEILVEKSMLWRSSRNSLRCRNMMKSNAGIFERVGAPEQAFQYFSKCSVMACSNIETEKKPHSIRCKKCWYYHFCSKPCERYANLQKIHDCNLTPPDKVQVIKNETESYLGLKGDNDDNYKKRCNEICNFCSAKKIDLPKCLLLSCSRCKKVSYCSLSCQKWDWPVHKQTCSKF